MCGIAGVFGKEDRDATKKMLEKLSHRGPDDEHLVSGHAFSLGCRRLSIIDLEKGRQPLSNEEGTIWVAQNGEIYNYRELAANLMRAHRFRTASDTEVIVHLYEERGQSFVDELNGMFAIALWDSHQKEGLLIRDRVGKKPLYYTQSNSGILYFASEIKALLSLPWASSDLRSDAVWHYLSYKHIPAPDTVYHRISALPAGQGLSWKDGQIKVFRYYRLSFSPQDSAACSEEELVEQMLQTLKESIRRRMVADVPIGFFLSGGVDSSLCVAIASELSSSIRTFTLSYEHELGTPAKELDRKLALEIARRFGTQHEEEVITWKHLGADLIKALLQFDQPFSGVISTYFLARLIRRHVKVAISGDGADELMGSYLSHRLASALSSDHFQGARWLTPEDQARLQPFDGLNEADLRYRLSVFVDEEKEKLLHPEFMAGLGAVSTRKHLSSYFQNLSAADPVNRMLEAEFYFQLPDQVLHFVDILSMAHGLEVRCPYLDIHFVAMAASLPGNMKVRYGKTKYLLKKAASRYLPEILVDRPKEGFLMPLNNWLLTVLQPLVEERLNIEKLKKQKIFRSEAVTEIQRAFYAGRKELGTKLWTLLAFQIWYDEQAS